jgi:glyoxylase-like metal-dependent hydrolase (beta-lactamase superfamily II)
MITRIHHLNCGTMCPRCQLLINGYGSWTAPGRLVCHCLLIETATHGLVLVDSGFGTHDIQDAKTRLGAEFVALAQPELKLEETAFEQIKALGLDPRDVRHIIPTHLDIDHAGGLADFPAATVHVLQTEIDQLTHPTLRDRLRFKQAQFDHHPKWQIHGRAPAQGTDSWYGFDRIQPIAGMPQILMIPLLGHTKGHVGIAVKTEEKWLLHCGDAYFHRSEVSRRPDVPFGMTLMIQATKTLRASHHNSLSRLRQLALVHGDDVELFCAHDPIEFGRYL